MIRSGPGLTWNLVLTAVLIPIGLIVLGAYIKKLFKTSEKNQDLLDDEKKKNLTEWQTRISNSLCAVKITVDEIKEGLHDKVSWNKYNEIKEEVIRDSSRIGIIEVKTSVLEDRVCKLEDT